MKTLVLIGAGGFARTLCDIVTQTGQFEQVLFLDDAKKDGVSGKCSDYMNFQDEETEFYPAISDNKIRQQWIDELHIKKVKIATVIHPSAYVSPTVKLADGIAVLPGSIVNTGCRIESGVLVNCGAVLDHDCIVEDCAHIRPRAVVKAMSTVPAGTIVE